MPKDHATVVSVSEDPDLEEQSNMRKDFQDRILSLIEDAVVKNLDGTVKILEETIRKNPEVLNLKFTNRNWQSIYHIITYTQSPHVRNILSKCIKVGFEIYGKDKNYDELVFFAAALGELEALEECLMSIKGNAQKINQCKGGDTILTFMLKYGIYDASKFVECVEKLLESGTDPNRPDYEHQTALSIVSTMYQSNLENSRLQLIVKSLLTYGANPEKCNEAEAKFISNVFNNSISSEPISKLLSYKGLKLFESVIVGNLQDFKQHVGQISLNIEDGENTLLQLAIIKNNIEIVNFLLSKEVNVNKYTHRNPLHPLLLAAVLNRYEIFKLILKKDDLSVDESLFNEFISLERKYFSSILELDNLHVNFRSIDNKSPLMHAISIGNSTAVKKLLSNGASLLAEDNSEDCLSYINPLDLEKYFDSCIKNENSLIGSEYNLQFDFKSLVVQDYQSSIKDSEVRVLQRIRLNKSLNHLLTHPLLEIYINLKWHRAKIFYFTFLALKTIYYLAALLLLRFVYNNDMTSVSTETLVFFFMFLIINALYTWMVADIRHYYVLAIDVSILVVFGIIPLLSQYSLKKIFNAVAFILMSISYLLFIGFHIRVSKYSAMLQNIFQHFIELLLFFVFPIFAFAVSFTVLFNDDERFSDALISLFNTFVMMTGEFNSTDFTFAIPASRIILLVFVLGMGVVLMNFWVAIAVNSIENTVGQDTLGIVVIFLNSVEDLKQFSQRHWLCRLLKMDKIFGFSNIYKQNEKKFVVPFYMYKSKQFKGKMFPNRLSGTLLSKLRKLQKNNEEGIFGELKQEVLELKNEIHEMKALLSNITIKSQKRNTKDEENIAK